MSQHRLLNERKFISEAVRQRMGYAPDRAPPTLVEFASLIEVHLTLNQNFSGFTANTSPWRSCSTGAPHSVVCRGQVGAVCIFKKLPIPKNVWLPTGRSYEGIFLKTLGNTVLYRNMLLSSPNTPRKDMCFTPSCKWKGYLYFVMEKLLTCEV